MATTMGHIQEIPAGPFLDALIASLLDDPGFCCPSCTGRWFGTRNPQAPYAEWRRYCKDQWNVGCCWEGAWDAAPAPFSTDLVAAFLAFNYAASRFDPPLADILWTGSTWRVHCGRGQHWMGWADGIDALPLAICRGVYVTLKDMS